MVEIQCKHVITSLFSEFVSSSVCICVIGCAHVCDMVELGRCCVPVCDIV